MFLVCLSPPPSEFLEDKKHVSFFFVSWAPAFDDTHSNTPVGFSISHGRSTLD